MLFSPALSRGTRTPARWLVSPIITSDKRTSDYLSVQTTASEVQRWKHWSACVCTKAGKAHTGGLIASSSIEMQLFHTTSIDTKKKPMCAYWTHHRDARLGFDEILNPYHVTSQSLTAAIKVIAMANTLLVMDFHISDTSTCFVSSPKSQSTTFYRNLVVGNPSFDAILDVNITFVINFIHGVLHYSDWNVLIRKCSVCENGISLGTNLKHITFFATLLLSSFILSF